MKAGKFLSNFLKSKDVREPITITITSVEVEEFQDDNGGTRESLVLYAKELEQGVVLSKTALSQVIDILGSDETDTWTDKKIVLFNDSTVQFKGKRVGGLRFREAA
jgi:hypothetical protein